MRNILSWVLTIPFLIAFAITLGIFDPLQRISRLFGSRPHDIVVSAMQVAIVATFRIVGTRIEVERDANIRPWTSYILISNHQSLFDIPICGALLFTNFPKYVSKQELAQWIPSVSFNLRRGGHALIDRDDPDQALRVIQEFARSIVKRGVSAVIYPEGTRSRSGRLRPFRMKGSLELLRNAPDVPVVPVTIDGSWHLLQNNLLPVPFRTHVRIRIGNPILRTSVPDDRELLSTVEQEIRQTITRWREDVPGTERAT